jgi:hypothetical protein
MIKKFICFLLGHINNWDEYDFRMEKEMHYGAGDMVQCKRCKQYLRMINDRY